MNGHGRRSRYVAGCRCEACTEADREYQRARRAERAAIPDELKPHGTPRCYIHFGCRCEACTEAVRKALTARKKRAA